MNQEKIQKLEDEVRDLFLNNADENWGVFWHLHLKFVIEKSKELAEKYGADVEVIWLAAILHDIAQLQDPENHEVNGSVQASEMLLEKGFDAEIAEKIKSVVLTHRVNEHRPENLEQKILATADAMSHFLTPHYFWIVKISNKPLNKLLQKFSEKIDRDYNDKIFFEDERKEVKNQYEVLKNWFEI